MSAQRSFHVHVYFRSADQRETAMALRRAAATRYPRARLGRIHEAPVAFHGAPMYQIALDDVDLGALIAWLRQRRGDLSLLVHPLLSDAWSEHVEQAIWLGPPVALDLERLRQIADADPDASAGPDAPPPGDWKILRLDAGARRTGSFGRPLTDRLIERLRLTRPGAEVIHRDLLDGIPLLDEDAVTGYQTAPEALSPAQAAFVDLSDALIDELSSADALVISLPIYNFHVPAVFKAWIDLVARARRTFRYTPQGPVGLLADRPVYVVVTSGGTRLGSEADFVSAWLRHVFAFLGLRDVTLIAADGLSRDQEGRLRDAEEQIDALTLGALALDASVSADRIADEA